MDGPFPCRTLTDFVLGGAGGADGGSGGGEIVVDRSTFDVVLQHRSDAAAADSVQSDFGVDRLSECAL